MRRFCAIMLILGTCFIALQTQALALTREAERLNTSSEVLREIMMIPEKQIPPSLLRNAYGVVIIPGVIKVGFILGGRFGEGVVSVRDSQGNWSPPVFLNLTGGSLGFQIGAQSTDVILVFKSRSSVEGLMEGKFTVGADASAAAGPVGRSAKAGTDIKLSSEIYSYSRSRGLFAGVSLEGAVLEIDPVANGNYYQQPGIPPRSILGGQVAPEAAGQRLMRLLRKYAMEPYEE